MKKNVRVVGVVIILIFIGSAIYWKLTGQIAFHEDVTVVVKKGISQIDICESGCEGLSKCIKANNLGEITKLMLFNEPSMGPSKTKHTYDRILRVYSDGAIECYRAVEYENNQGDIYLYQLLSEDQCNTFKYGAHSVVVKGLSEYIITSSKANQSFNIDAAKNCVAS